MITRRKFLARAGLFVPAAGLLIPRRGLVAQVGLRDPVFVALTKSQGAAAYTAYASTFDGTSDYMLRSADLTGNVDGKLGIVSFWVKFNGGDGALQCIWGDSGGNIEVHRLATNKIRIKLLQTSGGTVVVLSSNNSYTVASGWTHVLASWSISASSVGDMYINGAQERAAPSFSNANIRYTAANHGLGATAYDFTAKTNACVSEFYWNPKEYLDPGANIAKFYLAGKPVSLGATGATPTGTAPLVYFPNPYGTFQNNAGTGGNFTVTGALTTCTAP